jgi:hypothetical protein
LLFLGSFTAPEFVARAYRNGSTAQLLPRFIDFAKAAVGRGMIVQRINCSSAYLLPLMIPLTPLYRYLNNNILKGPLPKEWSAMAYLESM